MLHETNSRIAVLKGANSSARVLTLNVSHFLEAMRQLHVDGALGYTQ